MTHLRFVCILLTLATALLSLTACADIPDPDETRDQLTAVTESPQQLPEIDGLAEYDVATNPLPLVEPLDCSSYLVVTARGTGEPSRGQLLSPVVRAVTDARPGEVQTVDLDYPADDNVRLGGAIGTRLLIDTLNVQTEACPDQAFILLGYSQGALIIGDALVDSELRLVGESVGDVAGAAKDQILSIVLFANPRFTAQEPFNFGDFDEHVSGLLPRTPGSFADLADRMRDYCVQDDFICQANSLDLDPEGHMTYYSNGMQADGAAFVITRLAPLVPEHADDDSPEEVGD